VSNGDNQTLRPANEDEAAQMLRDARAARRRVDFVGGNTRLGLGRPHVGEAQMTSAALTGIAFYEPAEMAICAEAGTSLSTIEAALEKAGQMLPFEPMDHRALYASTGEPTIGGIVAGNTSGPRRRAIACSACGWSMALAKLSRTAAG
jgi:glycolate oxidase FAD binding subunit